MLPFFLIYFRLERIGREHAKVDRGLIVASNHRSFLDPFVIGALLPWRRPIHYVAKVELFEKPPAGLVPQPARRLPGTPRAGRRRDRRDLGGDPRARRRRLHLPRGHPDPARLARRPAPRRRAPGARVGRLGAADRGDRHRARAPRLEDLPAQGPAARRQGGQLSADRGSLAVAGRERRGADLAEHRAAVGVARRPAADAQGGGDRRRQLGHRGRRAARPRWRRGAARLPDRRAGRGDRRRPARTAATCPASICPRRSRSSAPARSRSPAST